MAVYGINYDDGNKKNLGYKSIRISYKGNKEKIFKSGNFVKDWFDLIKFIIMELSDIESHFTGSSDVDHFFMDGGDDLYDEAYLIDGIGDGKVRSVLSYKYDEDAIKFYVPKGTQPTWEELKEMCK